MGTKKKEAPSPRLNYARRDASTELLINSILGNGDPADALRIARDRRLAIDQRVLHKHLQCFLSARAQAQKAYVIFSAIKKLDPLERALIFPIIDGLLEVGAVAEAVEVSRAAAHPVDANAVRVVCLSLLREGRIRDAQRGYRALKMKIPKEDSVEAVTHLLASGRYAEANSFVRGILGWDSYPESIVREAIRTAIQCGRHDVAWNLYAQELLEPIPWEDTVECIAAAAREGTDALITCCEHAFRYVPRLQEPGAQRRILRDLRLSGCKYLHIADACVQAGKLPLAERFCEVEVLNS